MRNNRMLLAVAVAVVLACGFCGYRAVAQDLSQEPQFHWATIGHIPFAVVPLAAPGMFQGIVAMGPNPPATGDWPCFGPNTGCASVAAGGLVIGEPIQVWPKGCSGCGQIYWTFQTASSTGTCNVAVTVSQGSPAKAIYHLAGSIGTVPTNSIETVWVTGVSFTGGVAGAATISTSTTVGTTTIKGGAKIVLH